MKELVRFELYKIFRQKGIYVASGVLLFLIIFFMQQMPGSDRSLYEQARKWEGPVSRQELQEADRLLEKTSDSSKADIYRDVDTAGFFPTDNKARLKQITKEMHQLKDSSGYAYRRLQLQKNMLLNIHFNEYHYQWPVEQMQDYINTYGFFFSGAVILVGLSSIFTREKSSGVEQYILSSRQGRRILVHAKIIAACLFVVAAVLFSIGFDVLYWIIRSGNYGWLANIHSIPKYDVSPYEMNMLVFFLMKAAVHLLAGLSLAVFILFVSSWSKNTFVSFLISGFVFAFPFMAEEFVLVPARLQAIFQFSYATALRVDDWFVTFKTVNIFGQPLLFPFAAAALLLISSAVFLILLYRIMAAKQIQQ